MKKCLLLFLAFLICSCGEPRKVRGIPKPNVGQGKRDKPVTQTGVIGQDYSSDLALPESSVSAHRTAIDLAFTVPAGAKGLKLNDLSLNTDCEEVSYYFTWSQLNEKGEVSGELPTYSASGPEGKKLLLRLYSTRLESRCRANVVYRVNPLEEDSGEAEMSWPKMNFTSFLDVRVDSIPVNEGQTFALELTNGIMKTGGELRLTLNRVRNGDYGSRIRETLADIDGVRERLVVENGVIYSDCLESGVTRRVPVGKTSESQIVIEKEVLRRGCQASSRTISLTRRERGLIDFVYSSNNQQTIEGVFGPTMGKSRTP